jgi:hypothetical protein
MKKLLIGVALVAAVGRRAAMLGREGRSHRPTSVRPRRCR